MESRERLQRAIGSAYSIERELEGGGMSRVFLATETALGRHVVVKVLAHELSEGVSGHRFAREIRLAASLQQANIVPVLAAGDAEGLPYYTMPFVEGLSLRQRLRRDGLPPPAEAISILRDVARALVFAHEHGVMHRDIKPENVLLSGDAAVVTDFGIARALANARLGSASDEARRGTTVTQAGTAVGTPAYMAPEQIAGDPDIDHRADLYALGCMAYELLGGAPPFGERPSHAQFAAHMTERPAPVSERCPECPSNVARVVMRCLEKNPADRPQSAREVLAVLDGARTAATPLERFWQRRTRRQRTAALSLVVLAGATAATLSYARAGSERAEPAPLAMAVVPFMNLSGDPSQEYLADGLADELATSLGKIPGIRIASRSLSYRYKGRRDLDARELGELLSAGYVLQGSLRQFDDRLRVSVHLTSVADNSEAWSESYDRAALDAFAVQAEIARAVVDALRQRLGLPARIAVAATAPGSASAEAYDDYLHGRFFLRRRGPGVRQAVEHFERAIARDSGFAQAHASLAISLGLLPYFESVNARTLGTRAIVAAERALVLDNSLAEAHTALALAYQHLYRWRDAEEQYRRAVAVDSSDLESHIQYGRFLLYKGRTRESSAMFERARDIDPYSAVASAWYGRLLAISGRRAEGLREIRRALEFEPANPPALAMMSSVLTEIGNMDSAVAYVERLRREVPAWSPVAAASLAELGQPELAREAIKAIEARVEQDPQAYTRLITLNASLRDSTALLDAMERATARGELWPTWRGLLDPTFDFVRGSARFAAVLRSAGLDERTFTSPPAGRSR